MHGTNRLNHTKSPSLSAGESEKLRAYRWCFADGSSSTRLVRFSKEYSEIHALTHSAGLAINLLMLLALTHLCFPRSRRHTRKFFQLSYYNPVSRKYTLGWDDLPLVLYWIVVFTGLRVAVMDYVLEPLAHMAGIQKKKAKIRFAEQAWALLYATAFWSLGMVRCCESTFINSTG